MPARASWYDEGRIILYVVTDPITIEELERGAEDVWALAGQFSEQIDMIFDYHAATSFPRGTLPVVKEGHFSLPTLDRVALVGNEPLVEMMITTLSRATYRPYPTMHHDAAEAADFLRRAAEEDKNR